MSRLFVLKALISFFPYLTLLHTELAPPPVSHVMVLGEIKDEDLTKLKRNFPQKFDTLPSLNFEKSDHRLAGSFQTNRQEWIRFFSKTLLEERLNFRLGDSVQCVFFPETANAPLTACALIGREDEMATIETSLLELKQISLYGITDWELTKAKEQAWDRLYNTSSEIAEKSSIVLQSISTRDIQKYLGPLYSHVDKELNLSGRFENEQVEEAIQVKLCSSNQTDINPFYSLNISDSDKKTLYWVIHTVAKTNPLKLGIKQREVRKKAAKVEHLHPLRSLSYIMGEGGLRGDMQKIKKSSFKWNNFIDEYSSRLSRQASNNNLMQYVPGFAHSLGINAQVIQSYVERHDWYSLINYFL